MDNTEIRVKSEVDLDRAISYLQDIVSSLKQGRICVQRAEEALTLNPPSAVSVQVKASKKKDRESISLKVSWRPRAVEGDGETGLRISATAPPAQQEPAVTSGK